LRKGCLSTKQIHLWQGKLLEFLAFGAVAGIYVEFDGSTMLPQIAPRPLLVINGDSDDHTPLSGVQECVIAAQAACRAAKAGDHRVVRIQEKTGHKVTDESEAAAIEWFMKWLKP